MPDLSLKGVRVPELHLPEMTRDDIARTIADARRDVDLSRLDPRRLDLSGMDLPKLPSIDLPNVDVPHAVSAAAQRAGLVRRPSRAPLVIGGAIALGLAAWAALTSPVIRPRLDDLVRRARTAIAARRDAMRDGADRDEPHAFDAAVAAPIESSAFAGDAPADGTPFDGPAPLPDGFGADVERLDPTSGTLEPSSRN